MFQEVIRVVDATQNNLKHVSIDIPKHQITVVTGVSGSGKSSLVLDTIAAQSRRELNDTFPSYAQRYLPKYGRPHVGAIESLPPAIVVDQKKPSGQVRSTVGTYTDTYSLLRLLFSRVGEPFVGYSDSFSFNHPQGRCPRCDGLGEITEIDVHKLVDFNKCLNDEGVIRYVAYEPGQWRWLYYGACGLYDPNKKIRDFTKEELQLFLYQEPMTLKNPPPEYYKNGKYEGLMYRMNRMLKRDDAKVHWKKLEPLVTQGVCPDCHGARLNDKILSCKIMGKNIAEVTKLPLHEVIAWLDSITSPLAVDMKAALHSRVQALIDIGLDYLTLDRAMGSLSGGEAQRCKIAKYNNSSLSDMLYILDEPSVGLHSHDIHRLSEAIVELRNRGNTVLMVEHHKEMMEIADHIIDMGPGAGTQGGEVLFEGSYQELQQANTITGKLLREHTKLKPKTRTATQWYILEHLQLHNLKDVSVKLPKGLLTVIAGVAGSGKSSLMQAFAEQASSGKLTLSTTAKSVDYKASAADEAKTSAATSEADATAPAKAKSSAAKTSAKAKTKTAVADSAAKANTDADAAEDSAAVAAKATKETKAVKQSKAASTAAKATKKVKAEELSDVAAPATDAKAGKTAEADEVCEAEVTLISQKSIGISLRSTPATYMGVADDIRKLFAKESGKEIGLFSFNGAGACPVCQGKGVIISEMAFMDAIETECEACGGLRYSKEALQHTVDGLNIAEVMDLTVKQAMERFADTAIATKLQPLADVGLFYLHLNQALSTLSGGELQRMKLASYLSKAGQILVLDEPTDGLHLQDVQHLIKLFDKLVEQGNSIFVIEHNLEVLKAADYVVEVGPGGGEEGGNIIFTGTPKQLLKSKRSITRPYLEKALQATTKA